MIHIKYDKKKVKPGEKELRVQAWVALMLPALTSHEVPIVYG